MLISGEVGLTGLRNCASDHGLKKPDYCEPVPEVIFGIGDQTVPAGADYKSHPAL